MSARLGPRQLETLAQLCGMSRRLVVATDHTDRSLLSGGYLADGAHGQFCIGVTTKGLRALADAIDAGRMAPIFAKWEATNPTLHAARKRQADA